MNEISSIKDYSWRICYGMPEGSHEYEVIPDS